MPGIAIGNKLLYITRAATGEDINNLAGRARYFDESHLLGLPALTYLRLARLNAKHASMASLQSCLQRRDLPQQLSS